jgi:hypothetical protein
MHTPGMAHLHEWRVSVTCSPLLCHAQGRWGPGATWKATVMTEMYRNVRDCQMPANTFSSSWILRALNSLNTWRERALSDKLVDAQGSRRWA